MSHSPLSMRTDVVKSFVEREFASLPEFEQRRMQTTILQILAPIYAPPRSATPVDAQEVFRVALAAKREIDEREMQRERENMPPKLLRPVAVRAEASSFSLKLL